MVEVMYNKYYLGDECYVSTLGLYWFFGVINFNYKKLKSLMHFILHVENENLKNRNLHYATEGVCR